MSAANVVRCSQRRIPLCVTTSPPLELATRLFVFDAIAQLMAYFCVDSLFTRVGDGGLCASGYRAVDCSHARILRPTEDSVGHQSQTSPRMEMGIIRTRNPKGVVARDAFSCHAFSRDGRRLATGETGGRIQ